MVKPDENGNIKKPIAMMECRGLDIVSVSLGNAFTVTVAESGAVHENADFTYMSLYLGIYGANMTKKYQMLPKLRTQPSSLTE